MAIINRALIQEQLVPGLDMVVHQNYTAIEAEHSKLFELKTTDKRDEEYLMVGGFGEAATKEEGGKIRMDTYQELYKQRVTPLTVALGFGITQEAIEDDLYEVNAKIRAEGLGRAMAQTKQQRAANVWNLAFSTDQLGPQGVPMISDSHPTMRGAGAAFDNTLSGQLSETSLKAARTKIMRQKDDRGNFTGATVNKLIIPSGLYFEAHEILKSDLSTTPIVTSSSVPVSNSNNSNVLGKSGIFNEVVECKRLLDDDAWFVTTDIPNGPAYVERVALSRNDDFDPSAGIFTYFARERYAFTPGLDPRAVYGSRN